VPEAEPVEDSRWGPCRDDQTAQRPDGLCWQDEAPLEGEEAGEAAPVIPAVQASDVVRFAPATPAVGTEPDGIAVVGMPMNVLVRGDAASMPGTLFGLPMTVTFTPVEAVVDYGDGTRRTVPVSDATWAQLQQPQFTATPTSHAYGERGHYTVTVTVMSSAVVDFGVWGARPVNGLVASPSTSRTVQAVTADTGLVAWTCAENPRGPGC